MDSKAPIVNQPDDSTIKTIETNLASGARSFALKNYGDAADCFSMALEALSSHYGTDNHPALVDTQILYGKALLRNGVRLNAVLGGKAEVEDESEEKKNSSGKTDPSGPSGSSSTAPGKSTSGNINHPHIHFSGDKSSDEEEENDNDEEEEDIDNDNEEENEQICTADGELDSSFQILDLARVSLEVQIKEQTMKNEEKWKLQNKLIQVLELLSQVHQESEFFPPALESYLKSLEIKKSLPTEICSARSIAETHLYVALAYEMVNEEPDGMTKAMKHVEEAIELLNSHIRGLEADAVIDSSTTSNGDKRPLSSSKPIEEAEECRAILKDLEAKLEELKTVPRAATPTAVELAYKAYLANAIVPGSEKKTEVNDLNMLVKKKKQPVASGSGTVITECSKRALETDGDDDGNSKRSKTDEGDDNTQDA